MSKCTSRLANKRIHFKLVSSVFALRSKLISNGFSAFKTKQRAWCLRAVGTRVRHTFYVPFTGCQSRTESSTRSCCMFINLLITRLRSTSLTFSNCTMLPTALNTVDVDYAPLLMPVDLPYLARSVKLGTIRSTCPVLSFGIGFRWASETRCPSLFSKANWRRVYFPSTDFSHYVSLYILFVFFHVYIVLFSL